MRLRVVPVQFLLAVPDLVAVALNYDWAIIKGKMFLDGKAIAGTKSDLAAQDSKDGASPHYNQRGSEDGAKPLRQCVNEFLILTQGLEWIHEALPSQSG